MLRVKLQTVLDNCKSMTELKQIHCLLFTLGYSKHDPFVSKILSFSALSSSGNKSNNTHYSHMVLLSLTNPTTLDYNTVLRAYADSKRPNNSLSLFVKMLRLGLEPDHFTFPFLIKSSARLLSRELGVSVHAHVAKNGYELDRFVSNSLIHMYGSCGDVVYARKLFDDIPVKNSVSWNSMVDSYAKCGNMKLARELFDLMPERDVVSWSSLIDGYVKSEQCGDALAVFDRMRISGCMANEVTMVSVLCACAHLGALDKGRMMHQYMIDNGLPLNLVLRTSLVDMYAKCGAVEEAFVVFRGSLLFKNDILLWNAMIGGLATHGLVKESRNLFTEMEAFGIKPDEITYLCLLSACAHGGLVKEAWYYFEHLSKQEMTPKSEHYACMVDVMARAGEVSKAYRFLGEIPMEPTASTLGALLNGCVNHGELELAEIVGRKLIEIDPDHDGRYVGLSNTYAFARRYNEARSMREVMEKKGVKKSPGLSFVEMCGGLHMFIAHDKSHPCSDQIYMMLKFIVSQMKSNIQCEFQENFWSDIEAG